MDIVRGSVVKAKMGRDKDSFFVVVEICENGFVMIADGKRRTLEKPKKKNIRHLQVTKSICDIASNRQLRQALKEFSNMEDN